jgi:hypothetical protein
MEALGRLFDVSCGFAPVDLQTATNTGKRIHLKNAAGITFIVFKAAGTAGDDPVVSLQQHTAASSGSSANLAVIDHYYLKDGATLAGTEQWTMITQSVSQTITDPGGAGTSAEHQQILVIEVSANSLSDTYEWVSLNVADTGSNAQLGCCLYILHDLEIQRAPIKLDQPQL